MSAEGVAVTRYGGFRSVSFFAGLLGFNESPDWAVHSVTMNKGAFDVLVRKGTEESLTLVVGEATPDAPRFVGNEGLSLVYRAEQLPPDVQQVLEEQAFRLHPELTMGELTQLFLNDPDTWADEPEPVPAAPHKPKKLSGPERLVGDSDGFADFLARYDILCQKVVSLWLFNPCTLILHGDSECFGPPNLGLNMVMTINAPWDNRVRDLGRARSTVERVAEPNPEDLLLYVTDVREQEVIKGCAEKERKVFETVFEGDPGIVVFFHACVGVVAGSDIEGLYRKYKEQHNLPVLYFRGGENQALKDFYTEVLVDARASTPHPADAPKNRVNLVGYTGAATTGLLDGLERMGVEVNGVLLPTVALQPVLDFEKADLNVFMPNLDFENFYEQLKERSGIQRNVSMDAPYGVEGTKRWYRQVAAETGCEAQVEGTLEELVAPIREEWDGLRERARQYTVTLVARDFEAEQLLDSKYTYAVPVLDTLTEMGFGVEILLLETSEEDTQRALADLRAAHGDGQRVEVKTFGDFDAMTTALKESPSRAVFSNFFFDWRATSAGKSPFSLQHFEAGFDGAVRTLKRLVKVCETPFYRRYARFLQRDRVGRPVA